MKLIVGLGNPGPKYRFTRHNIGFIILDNIASDFNIRVKKHFHNSLCGKGRIGSDQVMLAKPLTYMNLSGVAVSEIKKREDIALKDLLIIMDDIDLPLGKIRLRPKGSSGGHKGLSSIIVELGTEEFPRLRIGIAPQYRGLASILKEYVLAGFKRGERKPVADLIEKSSRCVETWVREGIEAAMNRFNT